MGDQGFSRRMMLSKHRCALLLLLWTGYFAAIHAAGIIALILSGANGQWRGLMEEYQYWLEFLFYWSFGVVAILVSFWRSSSTAWPQDVAAQGMEPADNDALTTSARRTDLQHSAPLAERMQTQRRILKIVLLWTGCIAAIKVAVPIISICLVARELRRVAPDDFIYYYRHPLLKILWGFGMAAILINSWWNIRKAKQRTRPIRSSASK